MLAHTLSLSLSLSIPDVVAFVFCHTNDVLATTKGGNSKMSYFPCLPNTHLGNKNFDLYNEKWVGGTVCVKDLIRILSDCNNIVMASVIILLSYTGIPKVYFAVCLSLSVIFGCI